MESDSVHNSPKSNSYTLEKDDWVECGEDEMETQDRDQMIFTKEHGSMSVRSYSNFDPEKCKRAFTALIVMHVLPLSFGEYSGVRDFFSCLREDMPLLSRSTVKSNLVEMHTSQSKKIQNMFEKTPGRISLTCDLWTSLTTEGYIFLTAHFIDQNWVLRKRILNVSLMPFPPTDIELSEKVSALLAEWEIESKLFCVKLDDAFASNAFLDMLKLQLNVKEAPSRSDQFFYLRYCGDFLNLIVQDCLKEIDMVLQKVRESILHVKGSQERELEFLDCVNFVTLNAKKDLRLDISTEWNSTFLMLESALYFRMAFSHLEISDSNYKCCPSTEEWDNVDKLSKLLAIFYNVTCMSETKSPTANLYFPSMAVTWLTLNKHMNGEDVYMKNMATHMFAKFEKYWSEFSLILAVAVILDPRYKIKSVDQIYQKIYGNDSTEFKKVRDSLFSLFDEYAVKASNATPSVANTPDNKTFDEGSSSMTRDFWKEFEAFESTEDDNTMQKSELELYLDQPRVERKQELDILGFWKAMHYSYPVLAAMARDILSIPVFTAASKSAYSSSDKTFDEYHSLLKPHVLEQLICCKNWFSQEDDIAEMNLKEFIEGKCDEEASSTQCSNNLEFYDC